MFLTNDLILRSKSEYPSTCYWTETEHQANVDCPVTLGDVVLVEADVVTMTFAETNISPSQSSDS